MVQVGIEGRSPKEMRHDKLKAKDRERGANPNYIVKPRMMIDLGLDRTDLNRIRPT